MGVIWYCGLYNLDTIPFFYTDPNTTTDKQQNILLKKTFKKNRLSFLFIFQMCPKNLSQNLFFFYLLNIWRLFSLLNLLSLLHLYGTPTVNNNTINSFIYWLEYQYSVVLMVLWDSLVNQKILRQKWLHKWRWRNLCLTISSGRKKTRGEVKHVWFRFRSWSVVELRRVAAEYCSIPDPPTGFSGLM